MATIDMSKYAAGMGPPGEAQFWPLMPLDILWVALIGAFTVFPEGPMVVLTLACFFVHYFFGGAWRWQLYGLYAFSAAVSPALALPGLLDDFRLAYQAVAAFIVIVTVVSGLLLPRAVLPEATGPCRDVTKHTCVVDSQADGVAFMMTAYIPTKIDLRDAEQAAYLRSGYKATQGMASLAGVPSFLLNALAAAGTRLYKESWAAVDPRAFALTKPRHTAPGELSRLPVVVFSHGLGGVPDIYTALIAELCSHGFVVIGVEHNDGTAAHAQLPPRYMHSRPYEPLDASKKGKPRATYGVRSMNLHQRVREVLTAVDFVEALATIDQEPVKSKKRVVRSSGGRGKSAKDKRRMKEAEAAASAQSRERRKKQAGRAPAKAKTPAGGGSGSGARSGRTKGAMIDAGSIPEPQVIEIGDDDGNDDNDDDHDKDVGGEEDGEPSSSASLVAAGSAGSKSLAQQRRDTKQRSLHARSVNKLRSQAQEQAKAGATARKSDPSQGAGSAVDRMQQVNKANEDGEVEMMVELLRNCVDPSRVVLMGHSFGGATALQAASARSRAFSAVVALDTWAAPMHHTTMTRGIEPGLPVLALNCPRFAAPWNMRQLAPLLDPESRRAARARAEKHLAGKEDGDGLRTPRTEEERESSKPDSADGDEATESGLPTPDQCNGIDPTTGTPVVPIAGADAVDERCVVDRTLAVLEGTEHQSFTDVELVSGLFGKLAKQSGEGAATENQRLIAKTVARWLLGRVLGKAPAAGDDAPSSAAMAHDSPAFELRAPSKRGGAQTGRVPVSTAAVGGSASGSADSAADVVALVSKDTSGKVVRGLTEFGIGGDACTWDPRIKPMDLAAFRE